MRDPVAGRTWSATTILLVVNAVVFVAMEILGYYARFPFEQFLALSLAGIKHGYLWQLLTYQFLHSGLMHLLFNSLGLYMFGRVLEETLGKKAFLQLYFVSGIVGGLFQITLSWLFLRHFPDVGVVGASAAIFGLLAGFATLFPEQPITTLLAFLIPVTMRAKYLLLFGGLLALLGIVVPTGNIAHGAHLGGLLAGIAFIVWIIKPADGLFRLRPTEPARKPEWELVNVSTPRQASWRKAKTRLTEEIPAGDYIASQVDPILDKICAHGIQSLTDRERQILENARKQMQK